MYLKSIEIQGFKSFANKLTFEFHNGITGIVGPNGSGKSNVADAVRWVLGEQRIKQLRGASMQDVIFAGTELRKPQGFAYVAITLDNSDHQLPIDFEQVTVSRRLYRSGESEYRINGSACRLKDINELFYDTGIGKEGYSIIGQGQIERILNGKPEERRELFDEAAGIVKFKRRKSLAQKKLEDEQASLVRVSDILSELEKQVGPLERQSRAAKEYLQLKEQLKICDANLFLRDSEQLKKELSQLTKKKEIATNDLFRTQTEADQLKARYEKLEAESKAHDEQVLRQRESLNRAAMEQNHLLGEINVLTEQIRAEQRNEEQLKARREAIVRELEQKQEELTAFASEERELFAQGEKAVQALSAVSGQLAQTETQIRTLEQTIAQANADVLAGVSKKADVLAKDQRCEALLEQTDLRRSQVTNQLLQYKSDESVQDEQIALQKEVLAKINAQIEEKELLLAKTEEELDRAEQEIARLSRALNNTQQDYHTAHTKLESLKNLAERYDGYGMSIRRVMETRDRIHGIHGVVADLISAPAEYEIAIETALGGSIQNIVTDSEETAKRLIEYLKKNKFGRATFLPLTAMNARQTFSQENALKEPGVIGLASDLVQADPQYSGLVKQLLGRVVVADTTDHAIALARKFHYSLRIVTLEGELFSPGGSMTGGAFKNTSNLLGRRREIEDLEAACQKSLHQAESLQKELNLAQGLRQEKREESTEFQRELQSLSLEQNTASIGLSQLEEKKAQIAGSYTDLTEEMAQLELTAKEIRQTRERLTIQAKELDAQKQQLELEISSSQSQLETVRSEREQLAKAQSEAQMQASSLKQKADFAKENIARVQAERERLTAQQQELEGGSDTSREAVAEKKEKIAAIRIEIAAQKASEEDFQKAITEGLEKKAALDAQQKQFFSQREAFSQSISGLDRELLRLQAQEERLSERLEQSAAYLWNEYELTAAGAAELKSEAFSSANQLKEEITQLKSKIRALGNVNVNAIEDYREILERYTFLKAQHDDLTTAQAELEKIVEELDAGMRRQFKEKFAQIQAEFDKVFKELFGGGKGELELTQDEDILEAGIQIIAQPPGKKLQNMMQLSGGEKALTAISLLFAIQNLKPSPFCLLDEIEAALDDSNVDRFAGYLHKLTKNTQFIVITHRRGTMVSADRLYGITMQEKGVSALVSVSLIEDSLDK